jgi:hypothetical protein
VEGIGDVTHPAPVAEELGLESLLRNESMTRHRHPPLYGAIKDDGPGCLLRQGPATAFFSFCVKIGTGMYHTGHDFDTSMKSFQPLDAEK